MIQNERTKVHHAEKPDSSHHEIAEIRAMIDRYVTENQRLYSRILAKDPAFDHELYIPKNPKGSTHFFLKELFLKQIDQLMEEKNFLLKKREEMQFTESVLSTKKEEQLQKGACHYSVLRSAWTKFTQKNSDCVEKIDNLSQIVGMVKNSIKKMAEEEREGAINDIGCETSGRSSRDQAAYEKSRQKIEQLTMHNQELNSKYCQLLEKLHSKQEKIKELEAQLKNAGGQIKKSFDALCSSRQKIVTLEHQKRALDEKISKMIQEQSIQGNGLTYESTNEKFKIKIENSSLISGKICRTDKNLSEILDFLGKEANDCSSPVNPEDSLKNDEILMPMLNITMGEEKQLRPKPQTDRLQNPKAEKFIPMRTQRAYTNKSITQKTTKCSEKGEQDLPAAKKFNRTTDTSLSTRTRIGMFAPSTNLKKNDSL